MRSHWVGLLLLPHSQTGLVVVRNWGVGFRHSDVEIPLGWSVVASFFR